MRSPTLMDGVLLVDKPEGISSAGVIRQLKPVLGTGQVGHLGTLDPFASGLLPLCLGEATKIAQYLASADKSYTGVIRLGEATDTLDHTGRVVARGVAPRLSAADIEQVTAQFTGQRWQRPPMYSAVKRGGVPLYKLARQGLAVAREARRIAVHHLHLRAAAGDDLEFELCCSKGTYVRVLAAEIGETLGCGAHLRVLRRTRFGPFHVDAALPLDRILAAAGNGEVPLVGLREALVEWREFSVSAVEAARLGQGQQQPLTRLPAPRTGEWAKVVSGDRLVAIIEAAPGQGTWRLARVLDVGAGVPG